MSFIVALTSSAFLLGIWVDGRLEGRRPGTPTWRVAHVAIACVLLQLAAFAMGQLVADHPTPARQAIAVFGLLLPALVYTFVSGLWLIRTLAELGFARR